MSRFSENYFSQNTELNAPSISLHCLGGASAPIVNSIYPMKWLTEFHVKQHINKLTSRWMDLRPQNYEGVFKGYYHRLSHGHHLFEDGFKILMNSKLKFGEFLHHLGLDLLTIRGIPNPFIPTVIAEQLVKLGLSPRVAYEITTINLPKILGGSLGIVCSGADVFNVFSDAIPHTFLSAGLHFGFGALDLCLGMFPPNFILLTAGVAEIGVGCATTYNTIIDPILPLVDVPSSIFLPALGQSIFLSSLIGGCASIFTGQTWEDVPKVITASAAASTVSTSTTFVAGSQGFLGPFLGPIAGIATFLLVRKFLDKTFPHKNDKPIYQEFSNEDSLSLFKVNRILPIWETPTEPIGMIKNDKFLINEKGIQNIAARWVQ